MHESGLHIVRTAARSHAGRVRPYQEDAFLVGWNTGGASWDWQTTASGAAMPDGGILLAVADGMGGLNAGDLASAIAVEVVKKNFSQPGKTEGVQAAALLRQAILDAHHAIENESKKPENGEMGSTLVIAWLLGENLHVAWAGDSRCYRFRRNEGLKLLTKDHSLVQDLLDEGAITEAQAFLHPQRNVITQSLGISGRDPEPDYASFGLLPGDLLLLCSDGLNTMLTDEEIAEICGHPAELESCLEQLIAGANAAGGHDNVSVVLAAVGPGGMAAEKTAPPPVVLPRKNPALNFYTPRLFWLMLPLVAVLAALTTWAVMQGKISPEKPAGEAVSPTPDTSLASLVSPGKMDSAAVDTGGVSASAPGDTLAAPESKRRGDYVLIANSFSSVKEAGFLLRKLQGRYPDATVLIEKNNGLYEVRITGFSGGQEAEDFYRNDPDLAKRVVVISTEKEKND